MMSETKTEPYRPSNGTEGEFFYAEWCARCQREAGARKCGIIFAAMTYDEDDPEYPKEWVCDADSYPGNPRCTAFEDSRQEGMPL